MWPSSADPDPPLTLYLMRLGTQEMLGVVEVKGEATDASSSDREIPLCALFRA